MRKALIFLLLFLLVSCSKNIIRRGPQFKADLILSDFTKGNISVYKETKGKKDYLSNREIKVLIGNREYKLVTDAQGRVEITIPNELTTTLSYILVTVENHQIKLPYRKRKIFRENRCVTLAKSYFKIELRCTITVKRELWSVGENPKFEKTSMPFDGKITVEGPSFKKEVSVCSGIGELRLNKDEVYSLLKSPRIKIIQENKAEVIIPRLLPLDNQVGFSSQKFSKIGFEGILQNRTLYKIKVLVRAGYKKDNEWLVGSFTGMKYYKDTTVELLPGESREISVNFPFPLFGPARQDVKVEVISSKEYEPDKDSENM